MSTATTILAFRPYQEEAINSAVDAFLGGARGYLIQQPTGAGKAVQGVAIICQLQHKFPKILVAAPQQQIVDGFTRHSSFTALAFSDGRIIQVPKRLIRSIMKGDRDGIRQNIINFMNSGTGAMACTHNALSLLDLTQLPQDLSDFLFVNDEAHHHRAKGLSQFYELIQECGGSILNLTATPSRRDRRKVAEGMQRYVRSLAEHMADVGPNGERYAPRRFAHSIVSIGQANDRVNLKQFYGQEAPPAERLQELVDKIYEQWHLDREPRTIIRVPPLPRPGEKQDTLSQVLVRMLLEKFESQGVSVLDATGTSSEAQRAFRDALRDEQGTKEYKDSQYQIMVGIQRVLEGTDWPHCVAVYAIGMPRSLEMVIQLGGRALRLKSPSCPFYHKNTSRFTAFVYGGRGITQLSLDHSTNALMTACLMADYEVGLSWLFAQTVGKSMLGVMGKVSPGVQRALFRHIAELTGLDDSDAAIIRGHLVMVEASLRQHGIPQPTLEQICQGTYNHFQSVASIRRRSSPYTMEQIEQAYNVLTIRKGFKAAVKRAVQGRKSQLLGHTTISPHLTAEIREIFSKIREQFRTRTLTESTLMQGAARQVHMLMGQDMQTFSKRLGKAIRLGDLDRARCEAGTRKYAELHGELPTKESGPIPGYESETFGSLYNAVTSGCRGGDSWGYNGWDDYLEKVLGESRVLNRQKCETGTREFYTTHKRHPSHTSGAIPGHRYTKFSKLFHMLNSGSLDWGYTDHLDFLEKVTRKQADTARRSRTVSARNAGIALLDREKCEAGFHQYYIDNPEHIGYPPGRAAIPGYEPELFRTLYHALESGNRGASTWGYKDKEDFAMRVLGYIPTTEIDYDKCIAGLKIYGRLPGGGSLMHKIPEYPPWTFKQMYSALRDRLRGTEKWPIRDWWDIAEMVLGIDCTSNREKGAKSTKALKSRTSQGPSNPLDHTRCVRGTRLYNELHKQRPTVYSGTIPECEEEDFQALRNAIHRGQRGTDKWDRGDGQPYDDWKDFLDRVLADF